MHSEEFRVLRCAVPLVHVEVEVWVLAVELATHDAVSDDFRNDGRSAYCPLECVAVNDVHHRHPPEVDCKSIHEHCVRCDVEFFHGSLQCSQVRSVHAVLVYLAHGNDVRGPGYGAAGDVHEEPLALLRREYLGVVQPFWNVCLVNDYRCSHQWPSPAPLPCLIHSCNEPVPGFAKVALMGIRGFSLWHAGSIPHFPSFFSKNKRAHDPHNKVINRACPL